MQLAENSGRIRRKTQRSSIHKNPSRLRSLERVRDSTSSRIGCLEVGLKPGRWRLGIKIRHGASGPGGRGRRVDGRKATAILPTVHDWGKAPKKRNEEHPLPLEKNAFGLGRRPQVREGRGQKAQTSWGSWNQSRHGLDRRYT